MLIKAIFSRRGSTYFRATTSWQSFLVLTFAAFCGMAMPLSTHALEVGATQKPITQADALKLFQSGRAVSNRIIPATAIVAMIEWANSNGNSARLGEFVPLALSNCIVAGDLNLSGRTVPLDFSMYNVTFTDRALFNNTTFAGVVSISGVNFKSVVTFETAVFKSFADFTGDTFESFASFAGATFERQSTFYEQTFQHPAVFTGATFQSVIQFAHVNFQDNLDFSRSVFAGTVRFERVSFDGPALFRDLVIQQSATFVVTSFQKDAFFDELKGHPTSTLEFFAVTFGGRAYFDDSHITDLRFSPRFSDQDISEIASPAVPGSKVTTEFTRRFYSPTVFEKLAVFRGLQAARIDFTEAEFQDQADFIGARFGSLARFIDTTFKGEVNFFGAQFPVIGQTVTDESGQATRGLILDGVHFRDRVLLNWTQLVERTQWWRHDHQPDLKLVTTNPTTWYALEEVFRRSGNLTAQNEAFYHRRLLSRNLSDTVDESATSNFVSWLFWGYGVRPLRLLAWMVLVFWFFTWLYWTQTPGTGSLRLKYALGFSIRNSWKLTYGYERALTPVFRIVTLLHSLTSKVLALFLLQALANVSPLLNSIVGKLLPM